MTPNISQGRHIVVLFLMVIGLALTLWDQTLPLGQPVNHLQLACDCGGQQGSQDDKNPPPETEPTPTDPNEGEPSLGE